MIDSDTIDWQIVEIVDKWLDGNVSNQYKDQPLAQDWARICKLIEEMGETVSNLILFTGQNPRKQCINPDVTETEMLLEMADVVMTGILGIQHFTKDIWITKQIIQSSMTKIGNRVNENSKTKA